MLKPDPKNIEKARINYLCDFDLLDFIIKELNQKAQQEPQKDMEAILRDSPVKQHYKRMISYKANERKFYPSINIEYR